MNMVTLRPRGGMVVDPREKEKSEGMRSSGGINKETKQCRTLNVQGKADRREEGEKRRKGMRAMRSSFEKPATKCKMSR